MTAPRVVLMARRFWPLVDDEAVIATRLANSFRARGWPTTVLTGKWLPYWPDTYDHNGIEVIRMPRPASGWWSAFAYRRTLGQWFDTQRARFDLAVVLGLREDADVVVSLGQRGRFPVVLRLLSAGPGGDCHVQLHVSGSARTRRDCAKAAALVAPSSLAERELIASGYPRERIQLIPPGLVVSPRRTLQAKLAAREALAINPELFLPAGAWLALVALRGDEQPAVNELLQSWSRVIERLPQTYLWLMGDAALQQTFARKVQQRGLVGRVALVGRLDDEDDLFAAADTVIEPTPNFEPPLTLLRGMAAGLPPIVAVERGRDSLVIDGRTGRRVPPGHSEALLAACEQLQTRDDWYAELSLAAQQTIEQQYSAASELDAYAALFQAALRAYE